MRRWWAAVGTFVVANDKVTLSGSSAVIGVSSVEFAPSYAPGTSTDVAVLTLDSAPVPATTLQVLGAGDSADFANPASGQIAGWGTTGSIGSIPPNLLQGTVTLDTVGADCIFGTRCSETGVEPCNGDIGDPVIVQIGGDTVTSDPSPANGEWRLVAVPVALDDSICTGATYANLTTPSLRNFVSPPTKPPPKAKCGGLTATKVGTAHADRLTGTPHRDVIAGLGGNDTLSGLGGKDVICGGPGKDSLSGGGGNDRLLGQAGRDRLTGGAGRDDLSGGAGSDTCAGGPGKDTQSSC